MKDAIGTSLVVIAINCAAGLLGHLHHGGFDMRLTALVTALAVLGTGGGVLLSRRIAASLRRVFEHVCHRGRGVPAGKKQCRPALKSEREGDHL